MKYFDEMIIYLSFNIIIIFIRENESFVNLLIKNCLSEMLFIEEIKSLMIKKIEEREKTKRKNV